MRQRLAPETPQGVALFKEVKAGRGSSAASCSHAFIAAAAGGSPARMC